MKLGSNFSERFRFWFTFNRPDQELRDVGVGANHIWCKNIPKEHIKLKKLDLVQHSGSPIPISPLVCTLHVEGCTAQSMGVHKYATYFALLICILENGGTSERYTENFLQMVTIVFWMAFVPLQTSDSKWQKMCHCLHSPHVYKSYPSTSFMKSGQKVN